nr:hypothetical protein [Tanacetum cinerariifolium]
KAVAQCDQLLAHLLGGDAAAEPGTYVVARIPAVALNAVLGQGQQLWRRRNSRAGEGHQQRPGLRSVVQVRPRQPGQGIFTE